MARLSYNPIADRHKYCTYHSSTYESGHTGVAWGWNGAQSSLQNDWSLLTSLGYNNDMLASFARNLNLSPGQGSWHGWDLWTTDCVDMWFRDGAGNFFGYLDPAGGPINAGNNKVFHIHVPYAQGIESWEIQVHTDVDQPDWGNVTIVRSDGSTW
jgi:hypothetical protein